MGQRNNGQGEINALQNKFTAYLLTAIRREKSIYNSKRTQMKIYETSLDGHEDEVVDEKAVVDFTEAFSPIMQIEDTALLRAVNHLTPKERYILFERILNERSYDEMAKFLGLRYSGISTAYHRIIKKLRAELGGGRK